MSSNRIRELIQMSRYQKLTLPARGWTRLKSILYYKHLFGTFGKKTVLGKPVLLTNPHLIHIGNDVFIRQGVRLEAIVCDPSHTPELSIGDNVRLEEFVQVSSVGKIRIGPNVTIGCRTVIVCGSHPFLDAKNPTRIGDRVTGQNTSIEIGEGAFIGSGVAILQNVRIGKRAVIGANSVVKTNVPDYAVVEGNPARAVMRYDEAQDRWIPMK